MRIAHIILALPLLTIAACETGPIPVEQAEVVCSERAYRATRPTGAATIGASSSEGVFGGISIGLSSDFLLGRDPQEVYSKCVVDKSGQLPLRPLVL